MVLPTVGKKNSFIGPKKMYDLVGKIDFIPFFSFILVLLREWLYVLRFYDMYDFKICVSYMMVYVSKRAL